jgi:hypothetical protein
MPEAAGVPAASALHAVSPTDDTGRRGTTALHTGDVIRIDGAVEILQRIGVASP